ncbi:Alpha-crystallin B chain [Holothuria leucospilota]|uniref:Alpha-crystallin B chain n=1 Tax=Holothuria leucospilota TaxID=206669 RepID=A0A9Q1CA69_HOLLE|nr:Alpha-crystallin B chain [Holothuria leucospilota]
MAYNRRVPFTHPFDDIPSQQWPAMRRPDPWEGFTNRPSRPGFDRSFGDALRDDEFFSSQSIVPHRGYYVTAPSSLDFHHMPRGATGDMQLSSTEFKVAIDAKNFKPEELDVKIADDEVVIHGKHEEKSDSQGSVSREFTRRYKLPADVDPADVTSSLSEEGVLCIRGPRKGAKPATTSIPISIQGKPAVEQQKK